MNIKPLKIGNKVFENNIIQGPLAGVSSAPFRSLIWRYSQPAFSCTEMISCNTLNYQSYSFYQRFVKKDPHEGPLCFQLAGNSVKELSTAVKIATDCGADLIDLNCGCPVTKIRKKKAGSSLLADPALLYQLIHAMKQNTDLPILIKIRVDGQSPDKFNSEIVKVVTEAGLDALTVHGRHWTEHYETPCRLDQIEYFANELSIPVIGNGDVEDELSFRKMFATGCAATMIGRASVGQPWLIKQLISCVNSTPYFPPRITEIREIFKEHILKIADLLGTEKFAILAARKLAKYYGKQIIQRDEFCSKVNSCEDMSAFHALCDEYFV